ncbi:DUF2949 domain-containing protein [Rivularia sp. UHCC 0363]|uniref:DUF2949 domain-containing protein n=1 Tax=Rivularia sp. UHCC 0363 TaxID=3110244 RepID=UPI003A5990F6
MMLTPHSDTEFINFLKKELLLTSCDISVAVRKSSLDKGPLPMLLWKYGLVDIEQLERIFDWLEKQ